MGAAAEDAVDAAANGNGDGNGNHDTTTTTTTTAAAASSSVSGASSRYLVVFHAVSAGLNGAALGSDEQEIVFIVAVVLDVRDNQVRIAQTRRKLIIIRALGLRNSLPRPNFCAM